MEMSLDKARRACERGQEQVPAAPHQSSLRGRWLGRIVRAAI